MSTRIIVSSLILTLATMVGVVSYKMAMAQQSPDPQIEDIVRAGKLRVAVFPPLYSKDQKTGEIRGWVMELTRMLAARLGVEALPIEYHGPPKVIEGLKAGACDLAVLAIDPSWTTEVDFAPAFMHIDFTYLVPAGSSIRNVADADRPGRRIAIVQNHASSLALSRILKQAKLIASESPEAAFALLRLGQADAMASVRSVLLDYSTKLPGSAVLNDRYGANFLAVAVPKGRAGRLTYINGFIDEAKASGLLQQALERAGWRGFQLTGS